MGYAISLLDVSPAPTRAANRTIPAVEACSCAMWFIDRPCPDWPLRRLIGVLYKHVDDAEALEAVARMRKLAEDWRVIARPASRRTEDGTRRLNGALARPRIAQSSR